MGYESAVPKDIANTGLQITPTLITWTETCTFFDVSELFYANTVPTDEKFAMLEAYLNGIMIQNSDDLSVVGSSRKFAKAGDLHSIYKNAYCMGVQISTLTDKGTTHLRQVASWAMPGDMCSVEYDTYQQVENRSFAVDTAQPTPPYNLTTISYRPTNTALSNVTNFAVPFVASLRVPSVLQSVRVTQWEAFTDAKAAPGSIMEIDRPFWNADGIWGIDPGKLLYIGRKASNEGTKLHRVTYNFLKNMYGWHHFYALYTDSRGLTPRDITPIDPTTINPSSPSKSTNGAAAFKMLLGKSFADYFGNLKQPFNTGPSPNETPVATPDTLGTGDFFPLPDNVA